MSEPLPVAIDEHIVQDVVSTLTESLSRMNVRRELQLPQSAASGDVVVVPGDNTPQAETPCLFDTWRKLIVIACFIAAPEDEDSDEQLSAAAADIRKALRIDVHRGGLADNTRFPEADRFYHQASPPAVLVVCEVQYRTRYDNPYSQQ